MKITRTRHNNAPNGRLGRSTLAETTDASDVQYSTKYPHEPGMIEVSITIREALDDTRSESHHLVLESLDEVRKVRNYLTRAIGVCVIEGQREQQERARGATVNEAEIAQIEDGHPIQAIRMVCDRLNCGIRDAKTVVDDYRNRVKS